MTALRKLYRVGRLANEYHVSRKTLYSAIQNGRLVAEYTACGLPLVTREAVKQYLATKPRRGRPRGS